MPIECHITLFTENHVPTITLICSTHNEHGRCTAGALLAILRAMGPDVIFEEIRPTDFDAFYEAQKIVEVRAITQYRQGKPCQQVPVDRYAVRTDLLPRMKAEMEEISRFVGMHSEEYRRLDQEHIDGMAEKGFGYLNSDAYSAREVRMSAIEDEIIAKTNDEAAIAALKRWRDHTREREVAMVASIYEYCRATPF